MRALEFIAENGIQAGTFTHSIADAKLYSTFTVMKNQLKGHVGRWKDPDPKNYTIVEVEIKVIGKLKA